MRNYHLLRTMLVVHFAKDAAHPTVGALGRIGAGLVAAMVFGRTLAVSVGRAELPTNVPTSLLFCLALLAGFLVGSLLLLTSQTAQTGDNKRQIFQRVVRLLPLSPLSRWWLVVGPVHIVLAMVGVFGGWLIVAVAQAMVSSPTVLLLAWVLGLLSGHGLILLNRPRRLVGKVVLFGLITAVGFSVLDHLVAALQTDGQMYWVALVCVIFMWPIFGYWQLYRFRQSPLEDTGGEQKSLIPETLSANWWFGVKLLRNSRTRTSFLVAVVLNGLLALAITIKHTVLPDPFALLTVGSVLAATFACEVRGLMRRHLPPELMAITGTRSFVRSEFWSTWLAGCVLGLPMLFALHPQVNNSLTFAATFLVLQLAGSLFGLVAGTLLVPGSGETGNQLFAGILAMTALIMAPKLAHFADLDYPNQIPFWLVLSGCSGLGIQYIEQLRRKNYGRT